MPVNLERTPRSAVSGVIRMLLATSAISLLFALDAKASAAASPARDEQVMAVLDQYMDALNDLDLERHIATYHFPHFRFASGELTQWKTPVEAMPILARPRNEWRTGIRAALDASWHRSQWTRREIVQGDDSKVHVVTTFVRLREDGSTIATYESLYVVTFEKERWGIKGRSSFAP
jgi:hypothetical protein